MVYCDDENISDMENILVVLLYVLRSEAEFLVVCSPGILTRQP